jgi:hypothetical protein
MGKARVGLCVAAAALVLAGCVARSGGAPERAPATGAPVTLPHEMGAQVDPCSLTGPAAYEPHGTARMPGRPDMDSCRVPVATDEGPVYVWVGEQSTTRLLPRDRTDLADLGRGAKVVRYGDGCDTALVFDKGVAITAMAVSAGDEVPSEDLLCALARGAVVGVFNVLANDRVKLWRPAPNSLATMPACAMVPTGLVTEQIDIPSASEPTSPPAAHWCRWDGKDENQAELHFPVAESPAEIGVPDGVPVETIAGRESWVVAGRVTCTVYARHIGFALGVGTFEFAELSVTFPEAGFPDVGDPCVAARTLAASAWEHLPSVS